MMRRLTWRLLPLAPAAILLLAWSAWFAIDAPPPSVMPSIRDVITTMWDLGIHGRLPGDIVASLARLLAGVTVGIVTGMIGGFIAGLYRPVATFINPLVVVLIHSPLGV